MIFARTKEHGAGLQGLSARLALPEWLVWLLALVCVWAGLGAYGVLNNNEGLYAQIPQDMLHNIDLTHWIIPHLNGLPYMEKPPLLYWLTAMAFWLFGEADWVVRLVPTLASLACVWLLLNFGRRIYRPLVGRLAALMFISGLGTMVMGRTLIFDMLLTAFVTGSLMYAYLFKLEGHVRDLRIAHVCLAFGVLTKGLVALLLTGLVTGAWMLLVYRRAVLQQLRKWVDPVSLCLFFAITVPWFVAASLVEPIFPWFFFINEHVLRFLGLREPHDFYAGPWWYYLPRIVVYLFPWSLLVPIVLGSTWNTTSGIERQEFLVLRKTLILGWLVPLLFFSVSSAKANYYLIIAMPFLTLNVALLLEQCNFLAGPRAAVLGVVLALCASALALAAQFEPAVLYAQLYDYDLTILGMPWQQFALFLFWSVAGLSLAVAVCAWRFPRLGLVAYVALPIYFMGVMLVIIHALENTVSDRNMARFIDALQPARTVYLYRNFEQNSSLAFYLQRPIRIIDSTSADLYWGDRLRPDNQIMVRQRDFRTNAEAKAVVVENTDLAEFAHRKLHTRFQHNRQFPSATVFY